MRLLDELVAKARIREFDAVAVATLDRLARSVRHLVTLAGEWQALGVDLIVLDQGVDTSTPSGKLLFTVLAGIAEFERDLIRERTRAGLRAAQRRGKRLGRPRTHVPPEHARRPLVFEPVKGAALPPSGEPRKPTDVARFRRIRSRVASAAWVGLANMKHSGDSGRK